MESINNTHKTIYKSYEESQKINNGSWSNNRTLDTALNKIEKGIMNLTDLEFSTLYNDIMHDTTDVLHKNKNPDETGHIINTKQKNVTFKF